MSRHFYGVEKLHPFDTRKYSRAYEHARAARGERLTARTVAPPDPVSDADLLTVHTPDYLEKLTHTWYLVQALEFPPLALFPHGVIEQRVLLPMRLATQGTVLAAAHALEHGAAFNLSGGYHHASADRGEGFTVYSDLSVAVMKLRQPGRLAADARVLLIDLDAHQGNGHARVFLNDPAAYIFDVFNADIYPGDHTARRRINRAVPLASGTDSAAYLRLLDEHLPSVLDEARGAALAFYVAGTDIYERDPLGGLRVSEDAIFERDRAVLDGLRGAGIPWVLLPAGGYSPESYRMIARTLIYALDTADAAAP